MTTEKEMTLAEKRKPARNKSIFDCPYCKGYCEQVWLGLTNTILVRHASSHDVIRTAKCKLCNQHSIWVSEEMVYPHESSAPEATNHMPEDVKEVFDAARLVSISSPRSAAALLRLALEILTVHLGETEGTLYARIGNLKKQGLSDRVIKRLHIVRITANEGGVHVGAIDLTGEDGVDIVNNLFWLVNRVTESTIGEDAEDDKRFKQLPANKRKGVEDGNKSVKPTDKT